MGHEGNTKENLQHITFLSTKKRKEKKEIVQHLTFLAKYFWTNLFVVLLFLTYWCDYNIFTKQQFLFQMFWKSLIVVCFKAHEGFIFKQGMHFFSFLNVVVVVVVVVVFPLQIIQNNGGIRIAGFWKNSCKYAVHICREFLQICCPNL